MLSVRNPAEWEFVWHEHSDFVEVYHKRAPFPDEPVEVLTVKGVKRSESELKRIANESPDYSKPYRSDDV